MSLYKQFKTDSELEAKGVVLEYGHTEDGKPITIRIARSGGNNKKFAKVFEMKTRPYRQQIRAGTLSTEIDDKLSKETLAESVVIGWENVAFPVLDENGNQTDQVEYLPFSVKNCIRLFNDLPDLYRDIQEQSQRSVLFRENILEDDAKN